MHDGTGALDDSDGSVRRDVLTLIGGVMKARGVRVIYCSCHNRDGFCSSRANATRSNAVSTNGVMGRCGVAMAAVRVESNRRPASKNRCYRSRPH